MGQYDFKSFYKKLYEEHRDVNRLLEQRIADVRQHAAATEAYYRKLSGNPLIRLWKKTVPPVPDAEPLEEPQAAPPAPDTGCPEDSGEAKRYRRMVYEQQNPYAVWRAGQKEFPMPADPDLCIVKMEDCGPGFSLKELPGEYVLFVSKNGTAVGEGVQRLLEEFRQEPDVWIAYGNEDTDGEIPWFKPGWSPDTLLSFFYFGNAVAVRKEVFSDISWRGDGDWRVNLYDFMLRAACRADRRLSGELKEEEWKDAAVQAWKRIRLVDTLLFGRARTAADGETDYCYGMDESAVPGLWGFEWKFLEIKKDFLESAGFEMQLMEANFPGVYHVCPYPLGESERKVSVVIPSKDNPEMLQKCLDSLRTKTAYQNYEILVVDNGSSPENRERYESMQQQFSFRYLYRPMEFNFSAMCNIGAKEAEGELLLFLNDDVEVIEESFLRRMAGQALLPAAGAVGAKLWYPDGYLIQHAGITNLGVGPGHKLVGDSDEIQYYDGRNVFNFNYLAVTAACLMVRTDLFLRAGGLDETMPVAYNDVEFCFRLYEMGYDNVLRNDAVLRHHESYSRGLDEEDAEKTDRLLGERKRLYEKYPGLEGTDPYYSAFLAQDSASYQFRRVQPPGPNAVWKKASLKDAQEAESGMLAGNVDRVEWKQEEGREDLLEIEGWGVLLGEDNCCFKRSILLKQDRDVELLAAEAEAVIRQDVADSLPGEKRVLLSGMLVRAEGARRKRGIGKLGILLEDTVSGKRYYRWMEQGDKKQSEEREQG